jgi:multicomponent Na+:H+ antiporter subunit C
MIISFSLLDTGVHVIMVGIGYVPGGTAPIFDEALAVEQAVGKVVDPIPSALVLTAIVIGLAVTALMLSFAIRLHASKGSLTVDELKELKW